MTKYQRGDLMEGWNDCPPPPLSRDSSSSSISSTRSKRRTARLPGLATASDTPSPRRPITTPLTAPPMGRATLSSSSILASNSESQPQSTTKPDLVTNEPADVNNTPATLTSILKEANLSEKDETFFTKRLVDVYSGLDEPHKTFITGIVNGIASKQAAAGLKGEILNYMMVNSGVSTWCVPLKKLVETL